MSARDILPPSSILAEKNFSDFPKNFLFSDCSSMYLLSRKSEEKEEITLEQSTDDEVSYWPMFDSYVKQVIKASKCSFIRQIVRNQKVSVIEDTIIVAHHEDDYPSDHFYLLVDGQTYKLDDPNLYQAMQQLPDKLQKVLILKFWHQNNEKQIAQEMKVSIRTCYTRRKKALSLLKQIMENEDHEEDGSSY